MKSDTLDTEWKNFLDSIEVNLEEENGGRASGGYVPNLGTGRYTNKQKKEFEKILIPKMLNY